MPSLLPPLVYTPPRHKFLSIIYKDENLLVLSKPSGLLSVPGRVTDHQDSLQTRVNVIFPEALLVHRLDMDTSGVFVMAMNKVAQRHLGLQFERRKVRKSYIARVWGNVRKNTDNDTGRVDLPIRCDWDYRPRQMIDHIQGKPAQTDWQVLGVEQTADGQPVTRVRLMPITGRTHQLRVHMRSLGHPILGDDLYAGELAYTAAQRLQLHAERLSLHHPADGRVIDFTDPCPF